MVGVSNPKCKHCGSNDIRRWGGPKTTQTWKCKTCNRCFNYGKKLPKTETPIIYNYSLGYVIGVLVGDGTLGKSKDYWYFNDKNQQVSKAKATRIIPRYRHYFQLQCKDKEFTEEFAKHLNIITGRNTKPYPIKRKPMTHIAGNKLKTPYIFHGFQVQMTHKELYQKIKPLKDNIEWLKTIKKEVKKGFLRGIYDSEGGVYIDKYSTRIHLTNKDINLLNLIHILLKEYKIESYISNNGNNIFRLGFGNKAHVEIFGNNIGFSIKRKQNKLGYYE